MNSQVKYFLARYGMLTGTIHVEDLPESTQDIPYGLMPIFKIIISGENPNFSALFSGECAG